MKKIYLVTFVLSTTAVLTSCHKDALDLGGNSPRARTFSSDQLQNYFTLLCKISRTAKGFYPTQTARAYGYTGIAAYEAVQNGIMDASSLYGQVNGLLPIPQTDDTKRYNWAISSNAAVAEIMRDMFGSSISTASLNTIDSTENANLAALSAHEESNTVYRSVQYGKSVAQAVYRSSLTDGADKSYLNPFDMPYTLPVCESCWVPTNPAVPTPISPKWGANRPFILANVSSPPNTHTDYSADISSKFYANAMAVYNQVKNNTPEQVEIAKFWADDPFNTCTPAGHTFNILSQLLKEDHATLEKASVAYAKLAIAENDAFICCWKCKYQYNLIRPVSYIKKYIDPEFKTVIGTPAFPTYISGHATEMGAGSMVFTNMFTNGDGKYEFTDYSQVQFGFSTRTYHNFNDMAVECANSRFYAGIHYNEDNMEGLRMGKLVGDNVNKMLIWPTNLK